MCGDREREKGGRSEREENEKGTHIEKLIGDDGER